MILSREKTELSNPQAVSEHIRKILRKLDRLDRNKEHFFLISLNTKNRVKFVELVSIGTANTSLVHPREVFRRCIIRGASAAIVCHNHPSGESEPSEEDISITKRLVEAGKIIGIEILDHVIIGQGWSSMKEKGII
ncbi:MAG TPA: JAB domain-containing protein [Syntrophorhabdaceae bacterium]|nr:JAB domain-containing protein [Syntrophorhabdaceae bacterium]